MKQPESTDQLSCTVRPEPDVGLSRAHLGDCGFFGITRTEGWERCWSACLTVGQCSHHIDLCVGHAYSFNFWRWEQRDLEVEFKAIMEYRNVCLKK